LFDGEIWEARGPPRGGFFLFPFVNLGLAIDKGEPDIMIALSEAVHFAL